MSQISTTPESRRRTRNRSGCLLRVFLATLAVVIVSFFLTLGIAAVGYTRGEEFSPDTFSRRNFSYYRLPLIDTQITPIKRNDATGDFEKHLAAKKLIGPSPTTPQTWHLVLLQRGLSLRHDDASILCIYLDMYGVEGQQVWKKWTDDHPELAKVFWPAVAESARNELYVWIPDLMNLPKGIEDADELQVRIEEFLVNRYSEFARQQQQQGRHELAMELIDHALQHDPANPELLEMRATLSKQVDQASE